jgi:hypothetical protein
VSASWRARIDQDGPSLAARQVIGRHRILVIAAPGRCGRVGVEPAQQMRLHDRDGTCDGGHAIENTGHGFPARKSAELKEAAAELTADQAGLVAVGEPTIEKAVDTALTGAAHVVKQTVDATTDEITSQLQEALKS